MKNKHRENNLIIVSGASRGIGRSICNFLLNQGYSVIGLARNEKSDIIHKNYEYISTNISNTNLSELIQRKKGRKRILGLICCAGICCSGSLENISPEQFWKNYDVNVVGNFNLIKSILSLFEEDQGIVISITSDMCQICIPGRVGYSSSRKAQNMMIQCMQKEKPPIDFYSLALGITKSDLYYSKYSSKEEQIEKERKQIELYPMQRLGEYKDVNKLIDYLITDRPMIQDVIYLNGGANLL